MLHATGPFYGLDDLRNNGGDSELGPVALHPNSRVAKILRSPIRMMAGRVIDRLLGFQEWMQQPKLSGPTRGGNDKNRGK